MLFIRAGVVPEGQSFEFSLIYILVEKRLNGENRQCSVYLSGPISAMVARKQQQAPYLR